MKKQCAIIMSLKNSILFCSFLFRVDLACRLPELEQENSDDNLDSSSSMSSESLEDHLSLDSEGQ